MIFSLRSSMFQRAFSSAPYFSLTRTECMFPFLDTSMAGDLYSCRWRAQMKHSRENTHRAAETDTLNCLAFISQHEACGELLRSIALLWIPQRDEHCSHVFFFMVCPCLPMFNCFNSSLFSSLSLVYVFLIVFRFEPLFSLSISTLLLTDLKSWVLPCFDPSLIMIMNDFWSKLAACSLTRLEYE